MPSTLASKRITERAILLDILLPIGAGLIIGFLIGLTGMGGGALMTPFLILIMKLDPVLALGTDLAFASFTKIEGAVQHLREENVRFRYVLWMAIGSLPAAILSARFVLSQTDNRHLIEDVLPKILGLALIGISLLIFARAHNILAPRHAAKTRVPTLWSLMGIGIIGGVLVGLTSVGGGTVIMGLLIVLFTIPLHEMVGLDVAHGALLASVAAITYGLAGQTDWQLVGLMLIGSIPGVWLGARSVSRIEPRLVRTILSALILGAGIHLFIGGSVG